MRSRSRRNSFASAALVLALALIASAPFFFFRGEDSGARFAVIRVDGEEVRRVALEKDAPREFFTVTTPYGVNEISVSGGSVRVTKADCPDRVCVRSGAANSAGDVIACLPHRLLIEVTEREK